MSQIPFAALAETAPACYLDFTAARIVARRDRVARSVLDTLTGDLARLDKAFADTCEGSYATRRDLYAERQKLHTMIVALRDAADQDAVFVDWSGTMVWDSEWSYGEACPSLHDSMMSKYAGSLTALLAAGFAVDTAFYKKPWEELSLDHDPLFDLDDETLAAIGF